MQSMNSKFHGAPPSLRSSKPPQALDLPDHAPAVPFPLSLPRLPARQTCSIPSHAITDRLPPTLLQTQQKPHPPNSPPSRPSSASPSASPRTSSRATCIGSPSPRTPTGPPPSTSRPAAPPAYSSCSRSAPSGTRPCRICACRGLTRRPGTASPSTMGTGASRGPRLSMLGRRSWGRGCSSHCWGITIARWCSSTASESLWGLVM